jgi:hypothetical protein
MILFLHAGVGKYGFEMRIFLRKLNSLMTTGLGLYKSIPIEKQQNIYRLTVNQ